MKSNEFEKVHIKNRTCYYFNGIISISYTPKKWHHIYFFSLFCQNQS